MFYAHVGDATDNAFSTFNGLPVRNFAAFSTKAEREEFRNATWQETGGTRNVIDCPRSFVEKWLGKDFVITTQGVMSARAWEELQYEQSRA